MTVIISNIKVVYIKSSVNILSHNHNTTKIIIKPLAGAEITGKFIDAGGEITGKIIDTGAKITGKIIGR